MGRFLQALGTGASLITLMPAYSRGPCARRTESIDQISGMAVAAPGACRYSCGAAPRPRKLDAQQDHAKDRKGGLSRGQGQRS